MCRADRADGASITCKTCRVTRRGIGTSGSGCTMDHFSTVLQRPPHFDEDGGNGVTNEDRGPRGGLRDILNPVSTTSQAPPSHGAPGTPGAPAPPRAHSSFSLRSPTQADYHHSSPYAASPPSAAVGSQPPAPRSILNNPFATASTPSLPPPLQAPQSIAPSSASGLQHPPRSPLHAPPVYYPSDIRDRESVREKSGPSSFYDPTTDTRERERRVSDTTSSWRHATQNSTPKVSKRACLNSVSAGAPRWAIPRPFLCP